MGEILEEHRTSWFQTLMHVVKGHSGAGMFSVGYVIKHVGLFVGIPLTPLIPLVVLHTYFILLNVADTLWLKVETVSGHLSIKDLEHEKYSLQNYCYVAEKVFELGNVEGLQKYSVLMRNIVIFFSYSMHLGFCIIYLVFAGTNFKNLADPYYKISVRFWITISVLPVFLASLCPSLQLLSMMSTFGNMCLMSGCAVCYYFVVDGMGQYSDFKYNVHWPSFPLYFCVIIFSFAAITTVLPFRSEMKKPEEFASPCGALTIGYLTVILLISSLGIMSYYRYGPEIKESVTLNLPQNWLGLSTSIAVTTSVLVTYPINIYIPVSIIWESFSERYGPFDHPTVIILLFKCVLVIFTSLSALIIPYVELLMALVAAISSTILTFVVPPILQMLIVYHPLLPWYTKIYYWIKNMLLIILGLIIFCVGSYTTIQDIIKAVKKDYEQGEI